MNTPQRPTEAIVSYAELICRDWDGSHQVISPLGVWLLLATLAPAADGDTRTRLEAVLGCDAEDAAAAAGELLADGHPAVAAAAAIWARPELLNSRWDDWIPATTPSIEICAWIPTQADADEWARDRTLGLIDTFPVQLHPDTALVLASALATRVTWTEPFTVTTADRLGGTLGNNLRTALRVAKTSADQQLRVVDTDSAGRVIAHTARSSDGLAVTSVLDVAGTASPAALHRAALDIASGRGELIDPWDLPIGDTSILTVTDRLVEHAVSNADQLAVTGILPAWTVTSRHDLAAAPGVPDALDAMAAMLAEPADGDAAQNATATFTRDGFEAAAVTAFAMRGANLAPHGTHTVTRRDVTMAFNEPYAVVATATGAGGPWDGVPVFSAFIADTVDAT